MFSVWVALSTLSTESQGIEAYVFVNMICLLVIVVFRTLLMLSPGSEGITKSYMIWFLGTFPPHLRSFSSSIMQIQWDLLFLYFLDHNIHLMLQRISVSNWNVLSLDTGATHSPSRPHVSVQMHLILRKTSQTMLSAAVFHLTLSCTHAQSLQSVRLFATP